MATNKTNTNKETDQIRRLTNRVILSGALAELQEVKYDTGKDGVDYIRVRGAIQCGESAVYTTGFSAYIKAKRTDGEDNKHYNTWHEWLETAVPMTKDKDNPTMVKLIGSLNSNPYVGADNTFHSKATQNSMSYINDFDEYACTLDIEGYILAINDEKRGTGDDVTETGRKRIRLLSMDVYRNPLDMDNIVVTEDMVENLEDAEYEVGRTVTLFCDWTPSQSAPTSKPKAGGFGKQRTTTGRNYLELVLTGGDPPIDMDDEKAITKAIAKQLLAEDKARKEEIEEKGYQGSKTSSRTTGIGNARTTTKTSKKNDDGDFEELDSVDDEDIPF